MGKIVVTECISLDGVMEDPAGVEGSGLGSWTSEVSWGDEGDRFKYDETFGSEALLLGRVTYDGFAAAWPSRDGEFAGKFNSLPKYVVSSTLESPTWSNTTVLRSLDEVAKLKREVEGEIVVHGSASLAQALIEHDLVDEVRLMVWPLLLGRGKRLFADGGKKAFRLRDSKVVGNGVAILVLGR